MSKSIREAYAEALVKRAASDPRIVVLDADVSSSTRTIEFQNRFPERFFNVGIAEANMTGIAAGLSIMGKIPFINTFATFLESIGLLGARTFGSYSNMNMKFMGAYGGMSDSYDGPTHHSLEDIAIFRALPNFKVMVASDEHLTDALVKQAIDDPSPMYIRLSREAVEPIYTENTVFEPGKGIVLREGGDVTLIACGMLVGEALKAGDLLARQGIQATIVDCYCIKPIDADLVLNCARKTGCVVTIEEHNVIGGLGSAVAEVLVSSDVSARQAFIGMHDVHGQTGAYQQLLKRYGLTSQSIAQAAQRLVSERR